MKYHIQEKVLSMHGVYNVFDDAGNRCYYLKQKMISLKNKSCLYDAQEREIAHISRKVISAHAVHDLEMTNGEHAQIGTQKLLQIHDNYEIGGFEWKISGGVLGHDFEISDHNGKVIAQAKQAWISIGDLVTVDILDGSQTEKVVAVLITILMIHRDRRNTADAGA